jgi:tRNA 5-methylaminomethyl-2-thiouridine biosynthesis bifunctional protein
MTPPNPPEPAFPSPVDWDADGAPRSRLFDDVYYSSFDGLAESRAVYLEGCGLPQAWRGRSRFVIGELGFGTGLNVLALLDLWRRTREPGARLHIFSVEAFPMRADEAARALAVWPELADLAERLTIRWPRRARGFHRIAFDDLGAVLDLAVMDAADALQAWTGAADAWFLDGFSPACNPGMWSPAVLAGVARRSAPGARAATFTVAGAVRRGLEAQGFAVEKRSGFGRKKQRLEARRPDTAPVAPASPAPHVAILGAGIAGAALARAFHALGAAVQVIEAAGAGAGASGNPAALVMARLDAGGGAIAQLYAQALARASDLIDAAPGAVIAREAVQLEAAPKDPSRFDRIAASDLFEAGALERLTAEQAGHQLGEASTVGGLHIRSARVVEPAAILGAWLATAQLTLAAVARIEPADGGWRMVDEGGQEIARADIVCIAAGADAARLAPQLPISAVRGQASVARLAEAVPPAIWGGYAIPTRDGLLFGATHDRDETGLEVRAGDHQRNLALLRIARPDLAARIDADALQGRAGVRAVTQDFLPVAGPLADTAGEIQAGLYILSGLGSRGFCAAPLLAEHVAALALGAPSPLPAALSEIVDPGRFLSRRNRRGGRLVRAPAAERADVQPTTGEPPQE